MSTVRRLAANQSTRLNLMQPLNNKSEETYRDVLQAIQSNHSVTDVYLGPYFYASLDDASRSVFIRGLGQDLRHLRSLSIGTLEHTKARISGEAIGLCVAKAQHLHTLRVERDMKFGSVEEMHILAQGLHRHPSLSRVSLLSLNPVTTAKGMAIEVTSLDALLFALSSITNLESLQLGLSRQHERPSVTCAAVAALAENCPRLSWLYMARFPLEDAHLVALFATRQESLKVLDIYQAPRLTVVSWQALLRRLLERDATLESVNLHAEPAAAATKKLALAFLSLNRDGKRHRIRSCRDPSEWVQLVQTLTGRPLDVLYTLVRENPFVM
jgi:hypothetical protein